MPLSFADATGNLFNRLGRLGKILSQARSYQTSQLTNFTDQSAGAIAQLDSEPDVQAILGSAYISALNTPGSVGSLMQTVARRVVSRMVYRDNPRPGQTLTTDNVMDSIREIIRQMKAAGATVRAQTVTATAGSFTTNMGDAAINFSTYHPGNGLVQENSFAETLTFTVSNDSYTGTATAGQESILVTGEGGQGNVFAFDWPLGSGMRTTITCIDGSQDNGGNNLLTNSGFEDFTSNAPDNWEIVAGVAGTHFFEEVSLVYDPTSGGKALRWLGDGSTNAQIRQEFNDSTNGTGGELEPLSQYSFCLWMRRDGLAGTGTLKVELVDSTGAVIQDEAGTNNSVSFDLSTLSTSYQPFKGVFRTPDVMPDPVYVRLRLSTAYTSSQSFYTDRLGLGLMTRLYVGGPYAAVHSGAVRLVAPAYATCEVTNSRGAAGTLDTWQTLIWRLLPEMSASELLLPSAAVGTVADTLITS